MPQHLDVAGAHGLTNVIALRLVTNRRPLHGIEVAEGLDAIGQTQAREGDPPRQSRPLCRYHIDEERGCGPLPLEERRPRHLSLLPGQK